MTDIQPTTTQIGHSSFDIINYFPTNLTYYQPLNPIQIPINVQFIPQQANMTAMTCLPYDQYQPMYFVTIMHQAFQSNSCSDLNNSHQTNNYIATTDTSPSQEINEYIQISLLGELRWLPRSRIR